MLERFLSLVSGACKTGLKHLHRASWQSKDGIIVSPELSNMSSSWSVHKPERPWLLNKLPSAHFHIYFLLFGNRATHVASFFPCPLGTEVWQLYLGHLTRVVSWHFPLAPPDSAVRLLLATWHSVTPDVSSFLSSLLHASFPGENRTEPQSSQTQTRGLLRQESRQWSEVSVVAIQDTTGPGWICSTGGKGGRFS